MNCETSIQLNISNKDGYLNYTVNSPSDKNIHHRMFSVEPSTVLTPCNLSFTNYDILTLDIVYFANLYVNTQGVSLVLLQLSDLISTGIFALPNVSLHIVLSMPGEIVSEVHYALSDLFEHKGVPFNKIQVTCTTDNCHEYPGINHVYRCAQVSSNPNHVILYFHSKGITRFTGQRDPVEQVLHNTVVKDWVWVLFLFTNFCEIEKIGIAASEFGWIWYNYWWVRASYIRTVEEPIRTDRRHYYEDWLCRSTPLNNWTLGEKEINHNNYSNLNYKNCLSLVANPPDLCSVGNYRSPFEALEAKRFSIG